MRQSEMYHGMICYLPGSDGEVYENTTMVRLKRIGISETGGYSGRNDCSEVVVVRKRGGDGEDKDMFDPVLVKETEWMRLNSPEKIGQPLTRIVKNRKLVSRRKGDEQISKRVIEEAERQRRQDEMARARDEMTALLVPRGISVEDIHVSVRFNFDADAAEVQHVRISGESIERMIQVFRDFPNGGLDKPKKGV